MLLLLCSLALFAGCQTDPSHIRELSGADNLYRIDECSVFYYNEPDRRSIALYPATVPDGGILPESRPAASDPEGNWGKPEAGFQMSARLAKTEYTVGESVSVMTYLRNVSGKSLVFKKMVPNFWLELTLLRGAVRQKTKREMEEDANPALRGIQQIIQAVWKYELLPRTQHREDHLLNEVYDLTTPGEYSVRVGQRISPLEQATAKPTSGWARFTIVLPTASKTQ